MKNAKILGRFIEENDGTISHIWSGSGIEFDTNSSSLVVDIFAQYSKYEIWVVIMLNGATILRTMLLPGMNKIPVYMNLNSEDIKTIRILKDSQAFLEDAKHFMSIRNVTDINGANIEIRKPFERNLNIEFIGDSLTSGEGLRGAKGDLDFSYCYHSFENTFALLTADYFDADFSVVSQCGFGVACGWNNDPSMSMPEVYKYTDGKSIEYDFKTHTDFVVINLGTNDNGAFYQDPFDDGKNRYKITEEDFLSKGKFFLSYCLIKNPEAHIIWMIGMCDIEITKLIKEIINSAAEPNRVTFLKVPSCSDIDLGSRQHPGIKSHKVAARYLINKINELIK